MQPRPTVTAVPGRRAETERAARLLDGVPDGSGGMVVLAGPAGIGKTTTALGVLDALPADLLRAGGAPLARAVGPALWPWRQAARSVARQTSGGPLADLVDGMDGLDGLDGLDPAASHRGGRTVERTVERVVDAFAGQAARRPFVLHLEDVHGYDDLSLAVLEALCEPLRDNGIGVVACVRTDGPREADLLDALAGRDRVAVVTLPGLPLDVVEQILAGALEPGTLTGPEPARLSGGNPLLALELARAEAGRRAGSAGPTPVLARLVRDRVHAVGEDTVLPALAVVGRPATLSLLGALCELPGHAVRRVVDRAAEAGLVRVEGALGTVEPAHPLFAEVLRAGLEPATASRLHLRVADLLGRGGDGAGLAEQARHLVAGGDWTPRTAQVCLAAALVQERAGQDASAADLVAHGLDTVGDDTATRVGLLRARGRLLAAAGRRVEAAAVLARTVADARVLDDASFVGAVADLAAADPRTGGTDPERRRLLEEALDRCPDGRPGPDLRAVLLARLAEAVHWTDAPRSVGLAQTALDAALASGDAAAEALARAAWARCAVHLGAVDAVAATARELERHGAAVRTTVAALQLVPALSRGDRPAAEALLVELERAGDAAGAARGASPVGVDADVDVVRFALAVAGGDPEQVHRLSAAVTADGRSPDGAAHVLGLLWAAHSGRPPAAAQTPAGTAVPDHDLARAAALAADCLAVLTGTVPPPDEARRRHLLEAAQVLRTVRRDRARDLFTAVAALVGHTVRDTALCRVALDRFGPFEDRVVLLGTTAPLGPVGFFTALAHLGLGRRQAALASLDAALRTSRRAGLHAWEAQCLLLRASAAGDDPVGLTAAREALEIGSARGLDLVSLRARGLLGSGRSTATLSRAQERVLALAASGLTNDEIANRLGIGVSTVEKHLTQVYRRLGVRNRAASVSWWISRR